MRDVRPGTEDGHDGDFDRHATGPARKEAEAVRVLLVQPDPVEHPVGLVGPVLRVLPGVGVARVVRRPGRGHRLAGLPQAEECGLLDLIPVDGVGHGDAEVPVPEQRAEVGVLAVGLVERDVGVRAAEALPEDDAVLAVLLVLLEHGVVAEDDVPLLLVELAGDGGEVEGLGVREELELDRVDVRQLVPRPIHADVVGVAAQHVELVADPRHPPPRRHHGALGVLRRMRPRREELHPGLEPSGGDHLIELRAVRVFGVELPEVVGRQEARVLPVAAVLVREFHGEGGVRLLVDPAHRDIVHPLDGDGRAVVVLHPDRERRRDVLVQEHVGVPEQDVVGAKRAAVRPLGPLPQRDRPGGEVLGRRHARGVLGLDLGAVRRVADKGVVHDAVDVVEVARPEKPPAPHPAVPPDPLDRVDDERVLRQALVDRRQFPRPDEVGQHRRLVVRGRLGQRRSLAAPAREPDPQREQGGHKDDAGRCASHRSASIALGIAECRSLPLGFTEGRSITCFNARHGQ